VELLCPSFQRRVNRLCQALELARGQQILHRGVGAGQRRVFVLLTPLKFAAFIGIGECVAVILVFVFDLKPLQGHTRRQRQRPAHAFGPGGQQYGQLGTRRFGSLLRPRLGHTQHGVAPHHHALKRLIHRGSGQRQQPNVNQFVGIGQGLLGLEAGQVVGTQVQGQVPALTCQHIAQRVLQDDLRMRQVNQHAVGGMGVSLALAQRSAQHGLQTGAEFLRLQRAHACERQGPRLTQALNHLLHMRWQCVGIQLGGHMLQFMVEQLVQVQPAQTKEFFVVQRAAFVLQMHLKPFAKKRADRLAQEAGQLGERNDRGLIVGSHEWRQQRESWRWRARIAGPITALDILRRPPLFGVGL
jgi:hypothetical protein